MISGSQAWQTDLAAGQKQPTYAFQVPQFGIVLASDPSVPTGFGTPTVKQYYPGDYNGDLAQSLKWLLARQSGAIGNWLGNANPTPTTPRLAECGLVYESLLSSLAQASIENIVLTPPTGVAYDTTAGPDGFPVNYAPVAGLGGPLFLNTFQNTIQQAISGQCFNLNPAFNYRVDVYSRTDQFYYQGSAFVTPGAGAAVWQIPFGGQWASNTAYGLYAQVIDANNNVQRVSQAGTSGGSQPVWNQTVGGTTTDGTLTWLNMGSNLANPGAIIAALYIGGTPPALNSYSSALPYGWVAHSNLGVGYKLQNYFARVYVKTDIEYLQEDNIAIIVQDNSHARVGSSVVLNPGTPTVHVLYNDPVAGAVLVFTSLQSQAAYQDLVRSFSIPTSDPLYVPDVTRSNAPALQDRGFIYDQALAIIAFCAAGNYQAALKIIKRLNFFLDNPGYLASQVLENAEDGQTSRWMAQSGTVTNLNDPVEPPYGTGLVLKFHASSAGATFTYTGSGFPDTTDTMISFEHREAVPTSTSATIAASPNGAVRSSGTSTITTTAAHNLSVSETVVIAGVADASFNGTFTVATVPNSTTFTYAQTGVANSNSGGGSATGVPSQFYFDIGVTSSTGKVTDIQVNSLPPGPATLSGTTIIVPIGPGTGMYRTTLLNLGSQISNLVSGESLVSISSFKVTVINSGDDLYFDNLSTGNFQPANSLAFSYDIYYGQIDQAYIRAGAMAWVCYAYSLYMQLSKDYSSALYLQRMINFLLTLQSTASDLTNSLFYLGYGKYVDPGYQFVPGVIPTVATEHQIGLYFAFIRASQVLPTAATELQKAGTITPAQATSLNSTATQVAGVATTIVNRMFSNLWVAPGADPGHFAQGATGNTVDTSQALDASGAWAAIFAHTAGDDTKALNCLEFVYQKFYVQNQQILKSQISNSWNQAFQRLTPFSGFKPYNDSSGGYSGSPASVWQEGTWGMILALLDLYNVSGVSAYFASVAGSLDAFLARLIADQVTVKSTTLGTADAGAMLGWSLAARGLPWEFEVWPTFAASAWWYITAVNPSLLLSTWSTLQQNILPYLFIPPGSGQTVDELNGSSSIGTLSVESVDPSGTVKALIAQGNLVGQVCNLSLGFPGQKLTDFFPVETRQISSTGWSADGRIKIEAQDVQRFIMGAQAFLNGGPAAWATGQPPPAQPVGAQWLENASPVSDQNPRYVQGNPLDVYLAVMQNELGVGQDPLLPQSQWVVYKPGQAGTLINPNPYLDVPGILNLQSGMFSGDWFEFKITRPVEGKQWLEDEILKVLGLYTIAHASGVMGLKSMKSPQILSPVMAFTDKNIIGIPEVDRLPVINYLTIRFNVDTTQRETAAREYQGEVTFQQATSISQYKQFFKHQIEAAGLRVERGGLLRGFLIADRVFRRHAFATPKYKVKTQLSTLVVEVGDFVYLTHRLVPDFQTGAVGLVGVVCEVIDRKPNYAQGTMEFELLDTRFMSLTKPYQIAPLASNIPVWASATPAQRKQYMFISSAASGGTYSDATPGNAIF